MTNETSPVREGETMNETIANPSKKRRKRLATAGVVAAIAVAAVAGLWAWHETPSFCGAICHTPMASYVETYEDATQDKLGNPLDETARTSVLAHAHKGYNGVTCLDCHTPTLSEQVSEGIAWVSGDYPANTSADGSSYLKSRTLAQLTEATGADEDSFCLNDSCHPATPNREALAEKTERFGSEYNPHLTRHGEVDCGTCHKAHTQSVNYCTDCHASAPVPEGWLTMEQAREMGIVE